MFFYVIGLVIFIAFSYIFIRLMALIEGIEIYLKSLHSNACESNYRHYSDHHELHTLMLAIGSGKELEEVNVETGAWKIKGEEFPYHIYRDDLMKNRYEIDWGPLKNPEFK